MIFALRCLIHVGHTFPNPRRVGRVNWHSYHDELYHTALYDPPVVITNNCVYHQLQHAVTTIGDKQTYVVADTNERSQLPEEGIIEMHHLRQRWHRMQDPVNLNSSSSFWLMLLRVNGNSRPISSLQKSYLRLPVRLLANLLLKRGPAILFIHRTRLCTPRRATLRFLLTPWKSNLPFKMASMTPSTLPSSSP